jgi:hypothetical protein
MFCVRQEAFSRVMSRFSIQPEWINRAGVARVGGRAAGGRGWVCGSGGSGVAPDLRGHRARPAQPTPGDVPVGWGRGGSHDSSLHASSTTTAGSCPGSARVIIATPSLPMSDRMGSALRSTFTQGSLESGHMRAPSTWSPTSGWEDRRVACGMRRLGDRRCAVLQGVSLPGGDYQPLVRPVERIG